VRILVTGGAGYIGSITTKTLLDRGHECVVLDDLSRGHRGAVDPRAEFIVGGVGDRAVVEAAIAGCDAVMHLAGLIEVAESQREPELYRRVNAEEPTVMLEVMAAAGVDAIVYSSTAAVYGEPEEIPITEDAALEPVNAYGASKLAFEMELAARHESLRAVTFRYFNVAGAWPDGSLGEQHDPETHIIPRILGAVVAGEKSFTVFGDDYPTRDGSCVRDYIHVVDLAAAHVLALEHLGAGGGSGVFNLGNGEGFTNLEVLRACEAVTGIEMAVTVGPRRDGDPAALVASSTKARELFGWEPSYPAVESMVEHAWRWHSRVR
jgi:UDP-glucose 4-epimerase